MYTVCIICYSSKEPTSRLDNETDELSHIFVLFLIVVSQQSWERINIPRSADMIAPKGKKLKVGIDYRRDECCVHCYQSIVESASMEPGSLAAWERLLENGCQWEDTYLEHL